MAMKELRGHCTSPPYQLTTAMIRILGSATRLLPCNFLLSFENIMVAHKIKFPFSCLSEDDRKLK
ncbi:hypothetical protein Hdeb2414_s0001g00024021 [Helianthus debilis subsp. tardiflorus]